MRRGGRRWRTGSTRCSSPTRSRRSTPPNCETAMSEPESCVQRPERLVTPFPSDALGGVAQPLTLWERAWNTGALRKTVLLVLLAAAWEGYARAVKNPLLVPTFSATVEAFLEGMTTGVLLGRTAYSIRVLLLGYSAGIALAGLLTAFAVSSQVGTDR